MLYLCICKVEMAKKEKNNTIRHAGIIDSIAEGHVRVRIMQAAACAGCQVASRCSASEAKEKIVDVVSDGQGLQVGQHVVVTTTTGVARMAVVLGFGVPLLLLVTVVLAASLAGWPEEVAALGAIASIVVYYAGLWIMRGHVSKKVAFAIERL